jgi:putative membrane protein
VPTRGKLISIGPQLAGRREMVVMMFGYGYGSGWPVWGLALMWFVMIAFAGLLIWGVYALTAGPSRRRGDGPGKDIADPGQILDERLARGEIDTNEYAQLREALLSGSTQRPAGAGSRS